MTGIHSPTTTRSSQPSLSTSSATASVTRPNFSRKGACRAVPSVNLPWPSLIRMRLLAGSGYRPGITRPPTKRSRSPSLSMSIATTQASLIRSRGRCPAALVKRPVPLLRYRRSCRRGSLSGLAKPPLTTYRSGWPSPLASKKRAPVSSQRKSPSKAACGDGTQTPLSCWSSNRPGFPLAPAA